ncbi:hypothetical protein BBJ28_00014056 [Nothophytophthora sp. Chile5]|nr:hypothetical protein BBJ28_00014056 [Nothophytophthora sp. Chile5]
MGKQERRSMEEWADDDDEEENWKDALQDRVNQLELVFQHNNDATAAESRRRFEQQQQAQAQEQEQEQEQRATFSAQDPSGLRKRSTSTDFVARNIQGVEHHRKRSGSMSMERLVNDAQRLHFLEEFYQHQQRPQLAPSATSSTAVAPPVSPSSSAMSTS